MKIISRTSIPVYAFPLLLFIFFTQCLHSQNVTHPSWSKNAVIYEVNIRQYTHEGTFKAFEEHLPRLKEMGVDILWLMPINPIGKENRKGTLGSYYSITDYKEINAEFGNKEDFKNLVNAVHDMDMYVIVDWVANHTAWDHPWTNEHPEFYLTDSSGNFYPPVEDWSDVIALNYGNIELHNYMIDAMTYWVKEFDIDGYRCDVAAMVPIEFWKKAYSELLKEKHVFMLAEASEAYLHQAFDMTYNWQLKDLMNDIAAGKKNTDALYDYYEYEKKEYPSNAYRMNFTTNHDENSWNGTVFDRLGDGVETFTVLYSTVNGMPLVYSGQEAGLNKMLSFFEKDTIEWKESKFQSLFTKLFDLKENNKALWNGEFGGDMVLLPAGNKNVFAFAREKEDDKIFALFNFSDKEIDLVINNDILPGTYKNFSDGTTVELNSEFKYTLKPWGYYLLVK